MGGRAQAEPAARCWPPCSTSCLPICPPHLQPGGYFVNLGPLLYHWADAHTYLAGEQLSVELSLEEVKAAAASIGFRLVREELVPAAFLANQR